MTMTTIGNKDEISNFVVTTLLSRSRKKGVVMKVVDVTGVTEVDVCFIERTFRIRCTECKRYETSGKIPVKWCSKEQKFSWVSISCVCGNHNFEVIVGE